MKNLAKTLALSTALVLGLTIGTSAQTADHPAMKMKPGVHPQLTLTDAQKAQVKTNREKFTASLNPQQKAFIAAKGLKAKERMQKPNFKSTVGENRKVNRGKLAASLNSHQKAVMASRTLKPGEKMQKQNSKFSAHRNARFKPSMEAASANHRSFRAPLSPEQKAKMTQMKTKHGKKGAHKPHGKKA